VQALRGESITIYGDGQQTRSFCYIDDLVDALFRLMERSGSETGPLNLGNPAEFTMVELAEMVLRITGSRSGLVFQPLPSDDPRQRRPDISAARGALAGWEPSTPLEEGLRETVAYFRLALGMGAASRTCIQVRAHDDAPMGQSTMIPPPSEAISPTIEARP
jgi:UDP-glucuronate decarboxylase